MKKKLNAHSICLYNHIAAATILNQNCAQLKSKRHKTLKMSLNTELHKLGGEIFLS